jgi:3-oxoacyl-[acyl-carrier-protein] synthase II
MTTAIAVRDLAVTGCGVVSPAGLGMAALAEAMADGRTGCADPEQLSGEELLADPIRVVPDFQIADHVGRKGTRYLDRTTALGLVASRLAMAEAGGDGWESTGVVVGTSSGSLRSSSEFARDTLVQELPYLVNPGAFPNTVMNCCAGQIAIWNGLRGVNATVAGGHVSSLSAIRYARNAIGQGHVDRLLVGGVEELCAQSCWGWRHTGVLDPAVPVGEGCALFAVEDGQAVRDRGDAALAGLLACEVGFVDVRARLSSSADALARCVERAGERSGVRAEDVDAVAVGATGLVGLERVENRVLDRLVSGARRVRVKDVVGESYSAGGALQLAALLAHWRAEQVPAGRVGLVTSIGHDGNIGCLVVTSA